MIVFFFEGYCDWLLLFVDVVVVLEFCVFEVVCLYGYEWVDLLFVEFVDGLVMWLKVGGLYDVVCFVDLVL